MPGTLHGIVGILQRALRMSASLQMIDGEPAYANRVWRGRQMVVQAGQAPPGARPASVETAIRKGEVLLRITDLSGCPRGVRTLADGTLFGIRTYRA